jgi:hypothetical protein
VRRPAAVSGYVMHALAFTLAAALPLGRHSVLVAEISRLRVPGVANAQALSCEMGLALG